MDRIQIRFANRFNLESRARDVKEMLRQRRQPVIEMMLVVLYRLGSSDSDWNRPQKQVQPAPSLFENL
jgi:hypothetical protein